MKSTTVSVLLWLGWTLSHHVLASIPSPILLYSQNFTLQPNHDLGPLEICQGQEPVDVVYQYSLQSPQTHNLSSRDYFLTKVCEQIPCERRIPIVFTAHVNSVGSFHVLEGVEPIDAAHEFAVQHNFTIADRTQLWRKTCEALPCLRSKPILFRKDIWIDGKYWRQVVLLEGEEPADILYQQLRTASKEVRDRLLDEISQRNIPITRREALLYQRHLRVGDQLILVKLLEDGVEPVDVLWNVATQFQLDWPSLVDSLLKEMCTAAPCQRVEPVVWRQVLQTSENQQPIGVVEILRHEEPVDKLDALCQHNGFSQEVMETLLEAACQVLNCTRRVPIVLDVPVNDVANLQVWQDEDADDAIRRFLQTHNLPDSHYEELQTYFVSNVCGKNPKVKCEKLLSENVTHEEDDATTSQE